MERGCGMFLPIASIRNSSGYGTFSKEAYEFIDYLSENGIKYWQVLPINEMDYKKSMISTALSFAIDPLYIDAEKYMTNEELDFFKLENTDDFESFRAKKYELLAYLFDKLYFETNLDKYITDNQDWVYDYAVYKCLKDELKCEYSEFPDCYKNTDSGETITFIRTHSEDIIYHIFLQYIAHKQWKELKKYASSKGIKIVSSTSIFSSTESADVYANKAHFLNSNGKIVNFNEFYGLNTTNKEKENSTTVSSPNFDTLKRTNNNTLAMFNLDTCRMTKFAFLTKKFEYLSKLYDYIIIENSSEFDRFFGRIKENKPSFGTQIVNSSLDSQKSKTEMTGLKIYSTEKLNGENLTFEPVDYQNLAVRDEFFEILKDNKIKNIVLEEFINFDENENLIKPLRQSKVNFPVTKFMEFAFINNLDKESLPVNYEKNTFAYLANFKQVKFSEILEDEAVKSRVCAYLGLPTSTENETVAKMSIENLLTSNAGVVMVSAMDIFEENTFGKISGINDYKLPKEYTSEKFMQYLKELIINKNR